jgi:hypothetical protein
MSKNLLTRAAEVFTGDPVEAAKAKIDALATLEMKHFSRFRELGREIEAARATGGDEIINAEIDGGPLPEIARRLTELAGERESASLAMGAARSKRREAILRYYKLQAAALRERAAKLRAEAGERRSVTDELLAKLAVHEECTYIPRKYLILVQLAGGAILADVPHETLRREGIKDFPKSELLTREAEGLEREAAERERQPVSDSGAVAGGSLDEVIAAMANTPETIGPNLQELETWAVEGEARVRASRPHPGVRVKFMVSWRRGEIDSGRSEVAAIDPPGLGRTEAPPFGRAAMDAAHDAALAQFAANRARA